MLDRICFVNENRKHSPLTRDMLAITLSQAAVGKVASMTDNENGKNGGDVRAELLSPERRIEIAKKGADARWHGNTPEVLCDGILDLGGIKIPCYVTTDGQRLISGRAMQEALRLVDETPTGREKPGSRLTRLLNNKTLKPLIYKGKSVDHFSPVKMRWQGKIINGHNAEMLADICEGILEARLTGKLKTARQEIVAAQCQILHSAFSRVGIAALIDEATGYQKIRPADSLRAYLAQILKDELAAWYQKFPDEFYENIYKLKGWPWSGMEKNRYSVVGTYTKQFYRRLAFGLNEEFDRRNPKDAKGNRKHKNHEHLNDAGEKLFSQQMFTVIQLQRACIRKPIKNKWGAFLELMDEVLPEKENTLSLGLSGSSWERETQNS